MAMRIDQVVKQTGLTSRTLRYYESRGLIAPLRTASDRRIYEAGDLERIHRIITLKRAGLSLQQIGALLDQSTVDTAALLREQLGVLEEQAEQIDEARETLSRALDRIDGGEALDAETLCALIRDDEGEAEKARWRKIIDRLYSPDEQARWAETGAPVFEAVDFAALQDKAKKLSARIEAALPMDPGSDEALTYVREWFTLWEPFNKVTTPEMWEQSQKLFETMPEWEGEVDTNFSAKVFAFIMEAMKAARAAGKDIGPVPDWMKAQGF